MDKILYENEWLSLQETPDGYTFLHENRCNGIVAVIVYTTDEMGIDKILGRWETNPAHKDGMNLCAITGGIEEGIKPEEMAVVELSEEAGINTVPETLKFLGQVKPYKAADTTAYLYALDWTGNDDNIERNPKGDGSSGEQGAYVDWIDLDTALHCKDALLHSMMLKLIFGG